MRFSFRWGAPMRGRPVSEESPAMRRSVHGSTSAEASAGIEPGPEGPGDRPRTAGDRGPVLPHSGLRAVVRGLSVAVAVVGSAALLGWVTGVSALTTVQTGLASMKANTALCFVLWSVGTLVGLGPLPPSVARLPLTIALVLAGTSLAQDVVGVPLGVDELILDDGVTTSGAPGRMSSATAAVLCLLLIDRLMHGTRVRSRVVDALLLVAGSLSVFALGGYLTSASALYSIRPFASLSLPTMVCGLMATTAGLLASPDRGVVQLLLHPGSAGTLMRVLLPASLAVPTVGLVLARVGVRHGGWDPETMPIVLYGSAAAILAGLVEVVGHQVSQAEHRTARTLARLRRSEARVVAVLEAAYDGILTLDATGTVRAANHQAHVLLSDDAPLVGRGIRDVLPGVGRGAGVVRLVLPLAGGGGRPLEVHVRELVGAEPAVQTVLVRDRTAEVEARAREVAWSEAHLALEADLESQVRDRTDALQRSVESHVARLQDVHRRERDHLQLVSRVLRQQLHRIEHPEARAALVHSHHQVESLAQLHGTLQELGGVLRVELSAHLRETCARVVGDRPTVALHLALEPVHVAPDVVVPCALVLHELLTNACTHAADSEGRVAVTVRLERTGDWVALAVSDDGPGLPDGFDPHTARSLGVRVLVELVGLLHGRLELGPPPGADVRVRFPAPAPTGVTGSVPEPQGSPRDRPSG